MNEFFAALAPRLDTAVRAPRGLAARVLLTGLAVAGLTEWLESLRPIK
jgi:hypothetical protein